MPITWRVPLVDLARTTEPIATELAAAFRRVRASGQYVLGQEVEAFERRCAHHLSVEHAIGVSSGSDALVAALLALEIGTDDEVIVPTFTFVASAEAVLRVGARPVLVDSAKGEFHVDCAAIAAGVTPRTKAIMPVHLFGDRVALSPLLEVARAARVVVIEDAAQAFGAGHEGGAAGLRGEVGCYSFFPTKTLGAMGDGGLVVTRDARVAEKVRSVRQHGAAARDEFHRRGGNYRLDALQAALLHVRLDVLAHEIAQRRHIAGQYRQALADLADRIVLPRASDGATYTPFVVRIPSFRDRVADELAAAGIQTSVYYRHPLHRQSAVASALEGRPAAFPNADLAAAEALALPLFPGMREPEIALVIDELRRSLLRLPGAD
jgi:dTDP-4-amino-4,6-dideoxygalactose transaminase